MAAILEPRRHPAPTPRPALRLVTTDGRRTATVPVEVGLQPVHLLLGALALLVVVLGTLAVGRGALAGLAPGPSSPAPAASAAGANEVEVRAGDTLWSIARRLQPSGDVRPLVDELVALNGGGPLQPGDRIVVPSDGSVGRVRCPSCGSFDDKVIDSRQSEDGVVIRRRRACLGCHNRFTTFERLEETPLVVVKRSGDREPFDPQKVVAGLALATKGRPVERAALDEIAAEVEEAVRLEGGEVSSDVVGRAVLERLRSLDVVAAVRFASVYKEFDDLADFERELDELTGTDHLTKATEPKRH